MNRIHSLVCGVLLCLFGIAAHAQTTTITATNLKLNRTAIASGQVLFTAVDSITGAPIGFADGSGNFNAPGAFTCAITSGALSGCAIPDASLTTPANIVYQIQIVNTTAGTTYTMPQAVAGISGSTWALDHYGPPANASQIQTLSLTVAPGAPSGACISNRFYVNSTTNGLYTCVGGSWAQVSGAPANTMLYQGAYASGTTYAANSIVVASGTLYLSLVSSNTGNDPATSPAYWQASGPTIKYTDARSAFAGLVGALPHFYNGASLAAKKIGVFGNSTVQDANYFFTQLATYNQSGQALSGLVTSPIVTDSTSSWVINAGNIYNMGHNGALLSGMEGAGIDAGLCTSSANNFSPSANAGPFDLLIVRAPLINDVRNGALYLAQAQTLIRTMLDHFHNNCPSTDVLLTTENSLLTTDPSSNGWVTAAAGSETLVDSATSGVTSVGSHVITVAAMPTSLYVGGQIVVDSGASQETVTVTAMSQYPAVAGSNQTFTASFTKTHAQGFTFTATMASAAQAYTDLMRVAVGSFVGAYPNVVVIDLQSMLYGLTAPASSPLMINQLHPGNVATGIKGSTQEADVVASVLAQLATKPQITTLTGSIPASRAGTWGASYLNPFVLDGATTITRYSAFRTTNAAGCSVSPYVQLFDATAVSGPWGLLNDTGSGVIDSGFISVTPAAGHVIVPITVPGTGCSTNPINVWESAEFSGGTTNFAGVSQAGAVVSADIGTFTPSSDVTLTRVVYARDTASAGCTAYPTVSVYSNGIQVIGAVAAETSTATTYLGADSGALSILLRAGQGYTIHTTAGTGCTTAPSGTRATLQYTGPVFQVAGANSVVANLLSLNGVDVSSSGTHTVIATDGVIYSSGATIAFPSNAATVNQVVHVYNYGSGSITITGVQGTGTLAASGAVTYQQQSAGLWFPIGH